MTGITGNKGILGLKGITGARGVTGSKGLFGPADGFTPRSLDPIAGFLAEEATETTWPDTMGNGNDLTQSTPSNYPNPDLYMLKEEKTVYFSGSDSYGTTSGDLLNLPSGDNSFYVVYQLRDTSGSDFTGLFAGRVSGNTRYGCYLENSSNTFGWTHDSSTFKQGEVTTDYDTTSRVVAFRRSGTDMFITYAGNEYTDTGAVDYTLDELYIGSGPINIKEIWVFDKKLNDEEHAKMIEYCNLIADYQVLNDVASIGNYASNGAIFPQWSGSVPHSVYDSTSDSTYVVWQSTPDGSDLQFSINAYDHSTGSFGTQNDGIATYTNAAANYHGVPALCLDHEGYIHVFGGTHNGSCEWTVSDSARDISAFTEQTPISGTYAYPCPVALGSDIYLFARAQDGDSYDLALRKTATLSGGAATWESEVELATFGASSRFYLGDTAVNGNDIYLIAHYANSDDTVRDDVYLLIYDTVADEIRNIDGSTVVDAVDFPLDSTDLNTNFRIHETGAGLQCGNVPKMLLIDGNPHVTWMEGEETTDVFACYYMYWSGSSWSTPEKLGMSEGGRYSTQNMYLNENDKLVVTWNFAYEFYGPSFNRQESLMQRVKSGSSFGETKVFLKSGAKAISDTSTTLNGSDKFLITVSEISASTSTYDGALKLYAYGEGGFLS